MRDELSNQILNLVQVANQLRDRGEWLKALSTYLDISKELKNSPSIKHNVGLCCFALGKYQLAIQECNDALKGDPYLLRAMLVIAKAYRKLGNAYEAENNFKRVLLFDSVNADALLGLADLELNEFGNPIMAKQLILPIKDDPQHLGDVHLTDLMASVYDRDESAISLTGRIFDFSSTYLQMDLNNFSDVEKNKQKKRKTHKIRVGIISPSFCVSPVYFLTINYFSILKEKCDIIVFNRGTRNDWATEEYKKIALSWYDLSVADAETIAKTISSEQIDVLFDLGGWMDPVGLKALSVKPALKQYKWVGGQSITTGLNCFDGWIGDEWQSPMEFQHLYSEPLFNWQVDYADYKVPKYLPKPSKNKLNGFAVFANPAKLSRSFLKYLSGVNGQICFIHRQYAYQKVQDRITNILGDRKVSFVFPESHVDALNAVNRFAYVIDTFPYSSGLTAREVVAMDIKLCVLRVGELFCERHSARFYVSR